MNNTKKYQGFTLVELVLVIVVLGILSATALPKFIKLREEAVLAKLEAMEAALKSASNLVYAKSYLVGKVSGNNTLNFEGTNIGIHSGYPTAYWNGSLRYAINMDSVSWTTRGVFCEVDWCAQGNQNNIPSGVSVGSGKAAKLFPNGYNYNQKCGVYFINRQDGSAPVIGVETSDC